MSRALERIARAAYRAAMRAVRPLYLAKVRHRGRDEPLYAERIGERTGRFEAAGDTPPPAPGAIWLHAVSLGETRAAAPLVAALRARLPDRALLLTHGTATGSAAGCALLHDGDRQAWLPWDDAASVRRFLDHQRPAIGILLETEIWPTLIDEATARRLPMLLANARLNARSRARFERASALLRPAYRSLAAVLAQSEADAARLREVGARDVRVVGNLKYDVAVDDGVLERGRRWRTRLGGRRVVLAASTREGEEAPLLAAWRAIDAPRPLLVIVPRHPQRFDAVAAEIASAGCTSSRRSDWVEAGPGDVLPPHGSAAVDVWLGDSMLEMPAWYALADVALLGGSFAPLGGQNLIEAAACGCPLVMGLHTFNFAAASDLAERAGAARRVATLEAAVASARALLLDDAELRQMGAAAVTYAAANRGAADATAGVVAGLLERR